MRNHSRRAGFSLSEVLVATAVFSMVVLAAFQLYDISQKQYLHGEAATGQQQNTRIGFEQLMQELRLTGFDVNRDGIDLTVDEKVEYVGKHAIVIRANFNYKDADITGVRQDRGRELAYEVDSTSTAQRVITTSNQEIVVFALRSMSGATSGGNLSIQLDATRPRVGTLTTASLSGLDLNATTPPFELVKSWLDDSGNFVTPVVLADNIAAMDFSYFTDYSRTLPLADADITDLSAAPADNTDVTITVNGTDYTLDANQIRNLVRVVEVRLVGATAIDDPAYTNPTVATSSPLTHRRTFELKANAFIRNMLIDGEVDADVTAPAPPGNLDSCDGHCEGLLLSWTHSPSTDVVGYQICYSTNINPRDTNAFCFYVDYVDSTYISGLTAGSTYYAAIRSFDGQATPNYSGWADLLSPATVADNGATSSPGTVPAPLTSAATVAPVTRVDGSGNTIVYAMRVSWGTAQNNDSSTTLTCDVVSGRTPIRDLKGYKVYRRLYPTSCAGATTPPSGVNFGDFAWNGSGVQLVATVENATSWLDTTIPACTMPFYRVVPVDKCGYKPVDGGGNEVLSTAMTDDSSAFTEGDASRTAIAAVDVRTLGAATNPTNATGMNPLFAPGSTGLAFELMWPQVQQDTVPARHDYTNYQVEYRYLDPAGAPVGTPFTEDTCGAPLSGTTSCGADIQCYRHYYSDPAAPWNVAKVSIRLRAYEACATRIYGAYSTPIFFPGCSASGVSKSYVVSGNGGGYHYPGAPSSDAAPLLGSQVTLAVNTNTYLAAGYDVLNVTPAPLTNGAGVTINWTAAPGNSTCIAAPATACTYTFTAPIAGVPSSPPPYRTSYAVRVREVANSTNICDDYVYASGIIIKQLTACPLKTQANAVWDGVGTVPASGIPFPIQVDTGGSAGRELVVTHFARASDLNVSGVRVKIDKLAITFDNANWSAMTSLTLQTARFGQAAVTGTTPPPGQLKATPTPITVFSGNQNIGEYDGVPPYTVITLGTPVLLDTSNLYAVEWDFSADFGRGCGGGNPKMTCEHPGFSASYHAQPVDSAGVALGPAIWCAGDPQASPPIRVPFDSVLYGCGGTACPNLFPRNGSVNTQASP